MSPYEILMPGGGNEHYNDEPGKVWLERVINKWRSNFCGLTQPQNTNGNFRILLA